MTKEQILDKAIIEVFDDSKNKGVRVSALGEDFVITLHDLDNGKDDFIYDEAMTRLKELHMSTFTRKQAQVVCFYLDEINYKLIESGGEPFAEDWYTTNELYIPTGWSADYNARDPWYFGGASGCICNYIRTNPYFRCRPVINLVNEI